MSTVKRGTEEARIYAVPLEVLPVMSLQNDFCPVVVLTSKMALTENVARSRRRTEAD